MTRNETKEMTKSEQTAIQRRAAGEDQWTYRPDIDILETAAAYRIVADIPGAKKDAVDVSFEDGILSIDATVEPRGVENGDFEVREFGIGNYNRKFRISEDIDVSGINADYNSGVLAVTLPKREIAKRRKIEIKSG